MATARLTPSRTTGFTRRSAGSRSGNTTDIAAETPAVEIHNHGRPGRLGSMILCLSSPTSTRANADSTPAQSGPWPPAADRDLQAYDSGVLGPVVEGLVPGRVAIAPLERPLAVDVLDHVADLRVVVHPLGVRLAHAGATVADVGPALLPDGPGGGVQELPAVRQPQRPVHREVVIVRVLRVRPRRRRVHTHRRLAAHDDLDPAAGGERGLAVRHPRG